MSLLAALAGTTTPAKIDILQAVDGRYYYVLKSAGNHQVLVTSQMYPDHWGARRAAETFQRDVAGAVIA